MSTTTEKPQAYEFGFTFESGINLTGGEIVTCARVQWRRQGESRWHRFLLIGESGESAWSLAQKIEEAIRTQALAARS